MRKQRSRYISTAAGIAKKAYSAYKTYNRVANRFKSNGSYTKTGSSRNGPKDMEGVTGQHDRKVQYKYKPQPKYKRRRWKKFVQKVRAVEVADRGLQTIVLNTGYNVSGDPGTQQWHECHLYSGASPIAGCGDLARAVAGNLMTKSEGMTVGQPAGVLVYDNQNFGTCSTDVLFQSACLDVTWTNSGTAPIEGDIYTVIYKKGKNATRYATFLAGIDNGFGKTGPPYSTMDTDTLNTGGNVYNLPNLSKNARGVTLFDCGIGLGALNAKVIKKEKVFLPIGSSMSKNMRDARNRKFGLDRIFNQNNEISAEFNIPGWTVSYISCWKVAAGIVDQAVQVVQRHTRTYRYTFEGCKEVRGAYITDAAVAPPH